MAGCLTYLFSCKGCSSSFWKQTKQNESISALSEPVLQDRGMPGLGMPNRCGHPLPPNYAPLWLAKPESTCSWVLAQLPGGVISFFVSKTLHSFFQQRQLLALPNPGPSRRHPHALTSFSQETGWLLTQCSGLVPTNSQSSRLLPSRTASLSVWMGPYALMPIRGHL